MFRAIKRAVVIGTLIERVYEEKQEIKNLVLSQVMYQSRAPDYDVYGSSRPYIIALRLLEAGEC